MKVKIEKRIQNDKSILANSTLLELLAKYEIPFRKIKTSYFHEEITIIDFYNEEDIQTFFTILGKDWAIYIANLEIRRF